MSTLNVLVTGGAGFIGSHLVEALVSAGHNVTVLDNCSTGSKHKLATVLDDIHFVRADVRDAQAVTTAMKGQHVVFHYAALASVPRSFEEPDENFSTNVTGTFNVLNAAHQAGVQKLIFISSSSVYADSDGTGQNESHAIQPVSPYAHSKWIGEQLCHQYSTCFDMPITIFRYFNVYGTRQDPKSPYSGVLTIFSNQCLQNEALTIYGDGEQTRDYVHVSDVVQANLLAMQSENTGIFNIGSGSSRSLNSLVETLSTIVGYQPQVEHAPARPEARHTLASIEQAQTLLGYNPHVSFQSGLSELFDYMKAEKDLERKKQQNPRFKTVWTPTWQKHDQKI